MFSEETGHGVIENSPVTGLRFTDGNYAKTYSDSKGLAEIRIEGLELYEYSVTTTTTRLIQTLFDLRLYS